MKEFIFLYSIMGAILGVAVLVFYFSVFYITHFLLKCFTTVCF
jgi:hypothetical protein